MHFKPGEIDPLRFYGYMIGAIVPRPIAFVSTVGATGVRNLAPFSFFTVASVDPPVVCFSPLVRGDGERKDTVKNIEATGEFVLNIVSESFAAGVNACSAEVDSEVDEFTLSGGTVFPVTIDCRPGPPAKLRPVTPAEPGSVELVCPNTPEALPVLAVCDPNRPVPVVLWPNWPVPVLEMPLTAMPLPASARMVAAVPEPISLSSGFAAGLPVSVLVASALLV